VRPWTAIAGKELRDLVREKTVVVALVVQLVIAGFSAFLAVGLLGLYDPESLQARPDADVAYAGPGGFLPLLRRTPNIDVRDGTEDEAIAAFQRGDATAAVLERETEPGGARALTIIIAEGDLPATLLLTQLKGLLLEYEKTLREDRQTRLAHELVHLERLPGRPALPFPFLYGTLVPLLLLAPAFLSGAVAGDSLARERHTRTLVLLRTSPAGIPSVLLGKLTVPIGLAVAQFALWSALLTLNRVPIQNLLPLLALEAALTALLAAIGFAVAAAVRHPGGAQAGYAIAVLMVGTALLWLPRDPFNVIALLASGAPDGAAWTSLAVVCGAAATALVASLAFTAWKLRQPE
jgi:hypothetical protein